MSNTVKNKFQVGDIVEAFGIKGKIVAIDTTYPESLPVEVVFNNEQKMKEWFALDGRESLWHITSSLKLIDRPIKKIKKWVNLYSSKYMSNEWMHHDTKDQADKNKMGNRIECVELEFNEEDLKGI